MGINYLLCERGSSRGVFVTGPDLVAMGINYLLCERDGPLLADCAGLAPVSGFAATMPT